MTPSSSQTVPGHGFLVPMMWLALAALCAGLGGCADPAVNTEGFEGLDLDDPPPVPEPEPDDGPPDASEPTSDTQVPDPMDAVEPEEDPDTADTSAEDVPEEVLEGRLEIRPATIEVETGIEGDAQVQFRAFLIDDQDRSRQLIDGVQWSTGDPHLGVLDAESGLWLASGVGGAGRVFARAGNLFVSADIHVRLVDTLFVEGAEPGDEVAMDEAPDHPALNAPRLAYPRSGTMFPRGLSGVTLQWDTYLGHRARIRLTNAHIDLSIIANGSPWTPSAALWDAMGSAGLDEPLSVTLEILGRDGVSLPADSPTLLHFSEDRFGDAIYYWSTTDNGIMRAVLEDGTLERFLTPDNSPGGVCVGCHKLSNDGARMALSAGGFGPEGPLIQVLTDDPGAGSIDPAQDILGTNPTFSPDDARLVTAWGGVLTERTAVGECLLDPMVACHSASDCPGNSQCRAGRPLRQLPLPLGYRANFPDWSPDDRWLVTAATDILDNDLDVNMPDASLVIINREGEGWGIPEILLPFEGLSNNHPAFSPDGQWIAFERSNRDNFEPMRQTISQIALISPEGGDFLPLANANTGAISSWPRWSPAIGRYMWLTFTSFRPYGHVAPDPMSQIWVVAIDPQRAMLGQDPSFSAFWLPAQDLHSSNHAPDWAPYTKADED